MDTQVNEVVERVAFYAAPVIRRCGFVRVSGMHEIYWEEFGSEAGIPAVVVHGGPGSGTGDPLRRLTDPRKFRTICFDQRGSGKSKPWGRYEDLSLDASVADMEKVRAALGIDKWTVIGGSWGSTVAIAYTAAYPHRVERLVLWGVFLFRPSDAEWWLYGARQFRPEAWRVFAGYAGCEAGDDLLQAYVKRLFDPDKAVHEPAAVTWKSYERRLRSIIGWEQENDLPVTDQVINASRTMAWHFKTEGVTGSVKLLSRIGGLASVPGAIVHGRYDLVCPYSNAFELHQHWPRARLHALPVAGHALEEPELLDAVINAINAD